MTIPIDLRARFESHTVRNFFSNVTVSVTHVLEEMSFEDFLKDVSNQLIEGQNQEVVTRKINDNVSAQENLMIRFVVRWVLRTR